MKSTKMRTKGSEDITGGVYRRIETDWEYDASACSEVSVATRYFIGGLDQGGNGYNVHPVDAAAYYDTFLI